MSISFFKRLLKSVILLMAFSGLYVRAFSQPISPNVHRVLFLGNSITYAGTYIAYIETYYRIHYPNQAVEFINVGLPSETVSGLSEPGHADNKFPRPDLHERLGRILSQTRPDLVFACYGMNDGIYLPFNKERFNKFKEGLTWLHSEVEKTGANIVHLTPPVYDGEKQNNMAYVQVLDKYSKWILKQRKTGWKVIDVYFPMKAYLEVNRKTDPDFALASDGVHPGDMGHWIIAKQVLLCLGMKEVGANSDIHSAINKIPYGMEIYRLIKQKQDLTKDAWLTAIGHKRPGMKTGIPLEEALKKASDMDKQIQGMLNH